MLSFNTLEINEMKQTAALMLGILGLNEDFVQMNEIMDFSDKLNF